MRYRSGLIVAAVLVVVTAALDAQRRVPGHRADSSVPVTIALKADGKVYNFSGPATCTHAPVASIYGLRAERWTMDRSGDGGLPATLALWRPASGPDLLSLSFTIGETRYSVNT